MAKIQDIDLPYLEYAEAAAPATPASGIVRIYAKTDGLLYQKDDAGAETLLAAGAAGIPATIVDTKGDIIAATAADTVARLGVGANDTVLTADSSTATGLKWAAGGGGGGGLAQSFVGYNTIGGTWTTVTAFRYYLRQITLSAAALITSVDAHLRPSNDNLVGIYGAVLSDNAGAPHLLLGGSGNPPGRQYLSNSSSMPGTGRWISLPVGIYLASGTYWIGVQVDTNRLDIANDASGADRIFTTNGSFLTGAYPAVWPVTDSTLHYSIRASILA